MDHDDPCATARARRARLACTKVWTLVGLVALASVALFVLGKVSNLLVFLAVGCVVAYVATPLVSLLARHRVPRSAAALVGIVVVALGVVLLFALLVPLFVSQMTELLSDLPARIAEMGTWFTNLQQSYEVFQTIGQYAEVSSMVDSLQSLLTKLVSSLLSAVGTGLVPAVSNLSSALFVAFLGLVLAYWIACDYPRINDEICRVLGEGRAGDYRLVVAVISRSVGGYLRTTVIDSLIQGTLAFVGFSLAGHPYAGVMGVISGVLNFVPVVGPAVSAAIATVVALFYSPSMAFWTLVAAVVAQNVTDNLIVPKINQSTMQIHPVLTLTAIVLGSTLLGTVGMIIAIPLTAVAKSLFVFFFESRTKTQLVSYDGALFKGTPFVDAAGAPAPAADALGDAGFSVGPTDADSDAQPAATAAPRPPRARDRASRWLSRWRHGGGDERR